METKWHFLFMILASILSFVGIIRLLLSHDRFKSQSKTIIFLTLIVVVVGMIFGKYGANWGLPWWIYYPIPMLLTVFLPPYLLKFRGKQLVLYWILSFLSAPLIHFFFSYFLGWHEYMPFLKFS
jgi:hypothetical protein